MINQVERRISRVAESILENERLTADMDDKAATALMNWGVACGKQIAQATEDMDDETAEEAMYPRLRALRRLMRIVSSWLSKTEAGDSARDAGRLEQVLELAATVYGTDYAPPDAQAIASYLSRYEEYPPVLRVYELRKLIEY